jgi:hypothetical protein
LKKLITIPVLLLFYVFLNSLNARAQSAMQPKKYDNPQWKTIVLVEFKSGKYDRAKEIIKNYYEKAGLMSNTPGPSIMLDMVSGEYDMMLIWDMKGGIEDMNWEISPDDVKWRTAMNNVAGSEAKAKAIMDEFSSLVNKSITYIAKAP